MTEDIEKEIYNDFRYKMKTARGIDIRKEPSEEDKLLIGIAVSKLTALRLADRKELNKCDMEGCSKPVSIKICFNHAHIMDISNTKKDLVKMLDEKDKHIAKFEAENKRLLGFKEMPSNMKILNLPSIKELMEQVMKLEAEIKRLKHHGEKHENRA